MSRERLRALYSAWAESDGRQVLGRDEIQGTRPRARAERRRIGTQRYKIRLSARRAGWLKLAALPGVPLHDVRWRSRPRAAARVISDALLRLRRAELTHGDMCVPNILGDLATARLSGIVDWCDAGRFDHEIDVASAIWSRGYNGYPPAVAAEVLALVDWPRRDVAEVARLAAVWSNLAGPADPIAPPGIDVSARCASRPKPYF